jgi:PKD repeat protein
MKKFLPGILVSFVLSVQSLCAQEVKYCGTDAAMKQLLEAHPEMLASIIANEQQYTAAAGAQRKGIQSVPVYTIPVVFHVLHQNGPENISDAQIVDAINVLNVDMRKLNTDTILIIPRFKPLLADIKVVFALAKLDPQGNCTNGIDRIYTTRTNYGDDSAKVNPWPRDKYLNIWTAKALQQGWAGYAYYPSAATGSLSVHDGLMVLADYVGSIGTSTPYKSRTITHEVGHWLDLGHPWNTTINISINVGLACGDDLVFDTPTTKGHVTCPNLYTPDCMIDTFSTGTLNFNAVTVSSGTVDPTPVPVIYDSVAVTPFQATGLSANPTTAGAFSFSGWPTGAADAETNYSALTGTLNPAQYYEVTVAPKYGSSSMSLYGFKFAVNRSATGPRTYAVRSSADGFASNLTATVSPANANLSVNAGDVFFYKTDATTAENGTKISVSGTSFTNKTTPVTFRIYAWNAEDNLGSFSVDDVAILGSTGVIENIQNHMEYSYCTHMFTTGQMNRMRAAVESTVSGRSNLWSAANLAATGVTGPTVTCAPAPEFYANRTRLCKGGTVTFTKSMMNAAETSRQWVFQGGSPATSTAVNPTVTYSAVGVYSVSLSATNASGTNTITKTQYIRVDNATADIVYSGSYSEGFETATVLTNDWQSVDLENNGHKWEWVSGVGTGGSNAMRMGAFGNHAQDTDELLSPSFDLSGTQNRSFNFKVAASAISNTLLNPEVKDELKVLFSSNCGVSWITRATYTGTLLVNNPVSTTPFVPNAATVWTEKSIIIPSMFITNHFRVKFQFKSSFQGNQVYIDDVNLSQTVGLPENSLAGNEFAIYPNPSNETATISYRLESPATVGLEVFDVLGKCVYQLAPTNHAEGEYAVSLSKREQKLGNGVYFVKLLVNGRPQTKKLIISE